MNLKSNTLRLLDEIEKAIDPIEEDNYIARWEEFLNGKYTSDVFLPTRSHNYNTDYEFQDININDAIEDYELMLTNELEGVLRSLISGRNFLTVRANYGTGIMTSLLGAKIFTMPRNTNTLPTTLSIGDEDTIKSLVDSGVPPLENGFAKNVFEMGEIYKEVFDRYPKIKKYVSVYHPDAQGPLDVAELLWGSEMFYALYDSPELVHDLLNLVTDTYIQLMERWYKLYPDEKGWANHWPPLAHRGKILIRNDSAMNLSPEMYEEFAKPYDAKLLNHFDGGAVHFCGRGDHYIEILSSIPKLYAVNISQPHLNDMEVIYKNTVDKGIQLIGLVKEWLDENDIRGGGYKHNLAIQ